MTVKAECQCPEGTNKGLSQEARTNRFVSSLVRSQWRVRLSDCDVQVLHPHSGGHVMSPDRSICN